ncbi:MAG: SoxR reducing system RseC family protein [Firmicutes bacterium]|nr:SoxR reducing system RseC family protein [Bacillota bacterium]
MKQIGVVKAVHGKHVEVTVTRPTACKHCGACGLVENKPRLLLARNNAGAEVGDLVVLEIPDGDVLKAAAFVYGVPLLGLMVGLGVGPGIARALGFGINPSVASAIGGLLLMGIGYGALNLYDRSLSEGSYASVATEIVNQDSTVCASQGRDGSGGGIL